MMIMIADAVQMSSTSAPRVRRLDAARDRAHRVVVRAHHARAAIAHHARDATVAVMRRKLKMNRLWIHLEQLLMIERDHADLGKGGNIYIQGCWANSDDFLGKSLELIFVIIPTFSQILAT